MFKGEFIKKQKLDEFFKLFKNKYFYISLVVLFIGIYSNILSQGYLYKYVSGGKTLPVLSDIILDNIPYYDLGFVYDWFALFSFFVFVIFVVNRKEYKNIPFYIFMFGIFQLIRGIFIVLTPLGNPSGFDGTGGLLNGFSRYELGVYPSGHTGSVVLYGLLANGIYRNIIALFCIFVVVSLFLSRGHYSIDILSGLIFAYAIYSFGNKKFKKFKGE